MIATLFSRVLTSVMNGFAFTFGALAAKEANRRAGWFPDPTPSVPADVKKDA